MSQARATNVTVTLLHALNFGALSQSLLSSNHHHSNLYCALSKTWKIFVSSISWIKWFVVPLTLPIVCVVPVQPTDIASNKYRIALAFEEYLSTVFLRWWRAWISRRTMREFSYENYWSNRVKCVECLCYVNPNNETYSVLTMHTTDRLSTSHYCPKACREFLAHYTPTWWTCSSHTSTEMSSRRCGWNAWNSHCAASASLCTLLTTPHNPSKTVLAMGL